MDIRGSPKPNGAFLRDSTNFTTYRIIVITITVCTVAALTTWLFMYSQILNSRLSSPMSARRVPISKGVLIANVMAG